MVYKCTVYCRDRNCLHCGSDGLIAGECRHPDHLNILARDGSDRHCFRRSRPEGIGYRRAEALSGKNDKGTCRAKKKNKVSGCWLLDQITTINPG